MFRLGYKIGFTIVSSDKRQKHEGEDWMGIITGVKRFVRKELKATMKEIIKVSGSVTDLETRLESKVDSIDSQVKNLTQEIAELKDMVKNKII